MNSTRNQKEVSSLWWCTQLLGRRGWAVCCGLACWWGAGAQHLAAAASLPTIIPLPSPQAALLAPARIATDVHTNLWVSDPLAGKVCGLDASGREVSVRSGLGKPLGLAVSDDGTIYVVDAGSGAVNLFDPEWNRIGHLGQGAGEFQLPGYIAAVTESGLTTIYVSDGWAHQVKAYRNGVLVGQYGSHGMGPSQFDFPAGIWIGTNGDLFVVDQKNDRIQVLDRNGVFLRWFTLRPSPAQSSTSGLSQGVTGDGQGRLYVADTFQGQVRVYQETGMFLGSLAGYGEGAGQLRSPGGVVVDRLGRLWVANANNGRLEGFLTIQSLPILQWNHNLAGDFVLTWNDPRFDAQAATDIGGPWQTMAGASPVTVTASTVTSTSRQFFRLRLR